MNLASMAAELKLHVPKVPIGLAKRFVNRAWRDVRDMRTWSFDLASTHIVTPKSVNSGKAAITQGSTTVTLDATAKAAVAAAADTGLIPLTERQFRVGAKSIYDISAYDAATGTLTLKDTIKENTNSISPYVIFKIYYLPPADSTGWRVVIDREQGFTLRTGKLRAEVDLIDPLRSQSQFPYWIVDFDSDPSGRPRYELWPHPMSFRIYPAAYSKRRPDLTDSDSPPTVIPDHILIERSLVYCYQWAEANKGAIKELQGPDWRYLGSKSNALYQSQIEAVSVKDDDTFLTNLILMFGRDGYNPRGAAYEQSHDPRAAFV